ncbi:hypothetical protein [Francisella persica]|uniref:hypothetical protein n=1 Tax=Francisella persica TaxID=954 RepID=UPI003898F2BB
MEVCNSIENSFKKVFPKLNISKFLLLWRRRIFRSYCQKFTSSRELLHNKCSIS